MYTIVDRITLRAPSVATALSLEPEIRLNVSRADIETILVVIFCLVKTGAATSASVHRNLEARGCRFDRDVIDFLLNAYDGDDENHHLWKRASMGDYVPLYGAGFDDGVPD